MSWVWLNLPLGGVIFLAMTGIPLWMVIKRPDRGPGYGTVPAGAGPAPDPALAPARWNHKPARVPQIADRPVIVPRPRQARVPAWSPSAGR